MNVKNSIRSLLANPLVMKIPATALVSAMLAAMLFPIFAQGQFDPDAVIKILAGMGISLSAGVLQHILEAKPKDQETLQEDLEKIDFVGDEESNLVAAQVFLVDAQLVKEVLEESESLDKQKITDIIAGALKFHGGALGYIGDPLADALRGARPLDETVDALSADLTKRTYQRIEASRGGTIRRVKQISKQTGSTQETIAADNGTIEDVEQNIE
jgi:hypothetical protein